MKVTDEYIRKAFYRRFYAMTEPQQAGIIEALTTIRDARPEAQPSSGETEQIQIQEGAKQ